MTQYLQVYVKINYHVIKILMVCLDLRNGMEDGIK